VFTFPTIVLCCRAVGSRYAIILGALLAIMSRASAADTAPNVTAEEMKREAIKVAEAAAAAYPDDALTHALLGSAFYNIGRSDEATRHLQRCIQLRPDQIDAYEILARIAYEKGQPEEAARLSREGLRKAPANAELLNRLGRSLMDLGQTGEALQTLKNAVGLPNASSESWHLLAQCQMQLQDYASAKQSFLQTIKLFPGHTQAFFGLYTACLRLDQPAEAARYRDQFLKLESEDRQALKNENSQEETNAGLAAIRATVSRTLFGAAQIHGAHTNFSAASDLLRKAATFDPKNPDPRVALESLYVQRNELGQGLKTFEELAARQPNNSLNYLFIGRLHSRMNHFEEAEKAFQKVQELDPKSPEGYRALAELYFRNKRKPEQVNALRLNALELDTTGAQYYSLAISLANQNNRNGALQAVKEAMARNPNDPRFQQLLQQLQKAP
jgi:tetratricopeptide (TPR) repeat protein